MTWTQINHCVISVIHIENNLILYQLDVVTKLWTNQRFLVTKEIWEILHRQFRFRSVISSVCFTVQWIKTSGLNYQCEPSQTFYRSFEYSPRNFGFFIFSWNFGYFNLNFWSKMLKNGCRPEAMRSTIRRLPKLWVLQTIFKFPPEIRKSGNRKILRSLVEK
jgi:hypothetical protein